MFSQTSRPSVCDGLLAAAIAHAQWLGYAVAGAPRLANGTIDLSAKRSVRLSYTVTEVLLADSDVLEAVCNENEKDLAHLR